MELKLFILEHNFYHIKGVGVNWCFLVPTCPYFLPRAPPPPQLAVECMTEEEVMALYVSRAQELERDGKFKEAER